MRSLKYAALLVIVVGSTANTTNPHDVAVNAVYAQLAAARAEHNLGGMSGAFGSEGLLIDARPGAAISGAELPLRLKPMVDRLKADGVKVSTAYRIERRSIIDNTVIDAGYMRQTMTRADGQSGSRYARFLVTMRRDQGGKWAIIGDASMPADEAAFAAVPRRSELHYDS